MCGIIGYTGGQKALPVLLEGLNKLEYRGYDSAGVAVHEDNELKVVKCRGRLTSLEKKLQGMKFESTTGIGHTRWATHGEPNDINSHPHIGRDGRIAVVHNGIIENYMELKDFLTSVGYDFVSDTDTEVIAHLVDYYYEGDLMESVLKTIGRLSGSYALGVLSRETPGLIVAARKDSPLIIGLGKNENFIASDIPAIFKYTRDIIILEDNEVAVISRDNVEVFNSFGKPVTKHPFYVGWDISAAEKGGYEHFMMKEIYEEPKAVNDTLSPRIRNGRIELGDSGFSEKEVREISRIYIVACGTAYHAGIVGKYIIEKLARVHVEVDLASEFRYREPIISSSDLVIIISQSGETLDTLVALKEAKKKGAKILGIVNVVGSSIAREAGKVLYTWAGPEIAVASTKAYSTQLSALYLFAVDFAEKRGMLKAERYEELISSIRQLPAALKEILNNTDDIQRTASRHFGAKSIFYIGRGLDYALSMEGSLKLKEISYIHSEAYAGGELKHGTIALIEEGTLVICPVTQPELIEKIVSNMREVKARGAVILAIVMKKNSEALKSTADYIIEIPDTDPLVSSLLAITPLQLFAYYMALAKGCDVDRPRNLAKSVTVE